MEYNILIVEDELIIASSIEIIICKNKHLSCIDKVVDYDSAIRVLRTQKVDLVILDVNLSGSKSGIDVARYINKHLKIPFVYLTSYTDRQTLNDLKETLPAGFVPKPINETNLKTTVEIALNNVIYRQEMPHEIEIGKMKYRIVISEVLFAQADHVYTNLICTNQSLLLRISLNKLIKLFPEGSLLQVNRSTAVNPMRINQLTNKEMQIEKHSFVLTNNYRKNFF